MKTLMQEKDYNSLQHFNLVHKFVYHENSSERFGVGPDKSQK